MKNTNEKVELESVHISQIAVGDTVKHEGYLRTVCKSNLHNGGFCGTTLWGDSYRSGTIAVQRVVRWIK